MSIFYKKIIFIFLCFLHSFCLSANQKHDSNLETKNQVYDPVPMVMDHIKDAHDWHFFDYKDEEGHEHPVSIPLPVILYTNGNLDVFLSSEFHHGHSSVTKGDRIYALIDGHIVEKNKMDVVDLSITKNVASMLIAVILLLFILRKTAKAYRKNNGIPSGLQGFMEPLILFVKDDIIKQNIGKKYAKYLPFLLTVFFFILINNLLGLLPGSANVTGNIAVTLVLSVITFIITTISGNKNYWGHIFRPPGVPIILLPIMVPIEFLGIFTKPFALMIRLFANISAGHIIILSLISLIFIAQNSLGIGGAWGVAPVSVLFVLFISLIEILVAFLQAYIFTLLSAVFIGMAVVEEH
mgnify:CR=1 FL=1